MLKRYPNVRFVMAGSGDMMNRSIRRVAKLKIATKFHFTGFLRGQDVQKMFAHSDVYVMPSVSEPFGFLRWKRCARGYLRLSLNNREWPSVETCDQG